MTNSRWFITYLSCAPDIALQQQIRKEHNKKNKEEAVAKSATPEKTAPKRRSIHLEKTLDWINKLPEVEESEPTKTDDGATSSKCPVTNAKAFVYNRAASFAALIRKPPSATAKVTSSAAVKKEKKKKKIGAKSSSPGEAEASQKIGRVSWFITQCFFVATVLLLGTNIFTFGMWRKAAMEVQGSPCSVKLERQALDHEMRMTEVKETIKILAKQRTELDEHSRSLKKEYDAQNLQQQQRVEELERLHQACSAQLEELERKWEQTNRKIKWLNIKIHGEKIQHNTQKGGVR